MDLLDTKCYSSRDGRMLAEDINKIIKVLNKILTYNIMEVIKPIEEVKETSEEIIEEIVEDEEETGDGRKPEEEDEDEDDDE